MFVFWESIWGLCSLRSATVSIYKFIFHQSLQRHLKPLSGKQCINLPITPNHTGPVSEQAKARYMWLCRSALIFTASFNSDLQNLKVQRTNIQSRMTVSLGQGTSYVQIIASLQVPVMLLSLLSFIGLSFPPWVFKDETYDNILLWVFFHLRLKCTNLFQSSIPVCAAVILQRCPSSMSTVLPAHKSLPRPHTMWRFKHFMT